MIDVYSYTYIPDHPKPFQINISLIWMEARLVYIFVLCLLCDTLSVQLSNHQQCVTLATDGGAQAKIHLTAFIQYHTSHALKQLVTPKHDSS